MKLHVLALSSFFLVLVSCSVSKNQSTTVTGSELRVFKLFSSNDPEVVSKQIGTGCACGPTLASYSSHIQGCTIYLVTEENELIPSSENGSVIPFKNGATTCGVQECSLLREKFAHNTACVPFYGFLDKVNEGSLTLRQDSFIESITTVQEPTPPLAVKQAIGAMSGKPAPPSSGCGYKNQFSSINQCVAEQGKCMDTGWIYVTGCNYYCGGGAGWKGCEKPPDFNVDLTPDSFNYGMLSSGGQLAWNVGGEIVKIPATVGDGLKQLASSGADCISMGYREGSGPVLPACLTTAIVGGSLVVSFYYPPAAPYIASIGAVTSAWNIKNCVAPPNYNMEQAIEHCRNAVADGTLTLVPGKPIADIAKNMTARLSKLSSEANKYEKAWCAWGHTLERSRSGKPVKPIESSSIQGRATEIALLEDKGYGAKEGIESLLNRMGEFFSGDNTKYTFQTRTGEATTKHEMHIVLSNIKKEIEKNGQLALLMSGDRTRKSQLIRDSLEKLYDLKGTDSGVVNQFMENADSFFAAIHTITEIRYRFKHIDGPLPSSCSPTKIKDWQTLVDRNLDPRNVLSTGVRPDGPEGVTAFRYDFSGKPSVIFQIDAAKEGVNGVVISGAGRVAQYGASAQQLLGNPYVPYETMLLIEKGYTFRVTNVTQVPMRLPDGKGNWASQLTDLVTVKVVKSGTALEPSIRGSFLSVFDFINNFYQDETGQVLSMSNQLGPNGQCPDCKEPVNNEEAPEAAADCGYEVYEAQYNPRTCETFWWKDPQPEFQCKPGCVSDFENQFPRPPDWFSQAYSGGQACSPEPWNTETVLGCCEGMKQVKCKEKVSVSH